MSNLLLGSPPTKHSDFNPEKKFIWKNRPRKLTEGFIENYSEMPEDYSSSANHVAGISKLEFTTIGPF